MLDVRRLPVLRAFATHGTIARAAEALAFTPSAVSQQLAQLQREAGAELFVKVGRRLELSDAGRTLVERGDELLARVEEVEAELAAHAGQVRGRVRIAAFQTAARNIVLPALEQLARDHPGLRAELVEEEAEESFPLLVRGGVDVAIAEEYEHAPRPRVAGLERRYLEPDEMVLALPNGDPALDGRRPAAAGRAARPPLGQRPRRHGLRRDVHRDLPLGRRLRARRPPPRQRHAAAARPRGPGLRGARARPRPPRARSAGDDPPPARGALQPRDLRRAAKQRPAAAVHRGHGRRAHRRPALRQSAVVKRIGLLGGMSWESTAEYYRLVNEAVRDRLGGLHSADCLLRSVEFAEIEELQRAGQWDEAGERLAGEARALAEAGAELIVLCTNTMHKVADAIVAAIDVPFVHIADTTAAAVHAAGASTVGLLATAYTMEQDFYVGRLRDVHGLEVLVPGPDDRRIVHDVIYRELCVGVVRDESRREYVRIMGDLAERGAEGILLGCTEIDLLVGAGDSPRPVFDTTRLHAERAVELALEPVTPSAR